MKLIHFVALFQVLSVCYCKNEKNIKEIKVKDVRNCHKDIQDCPEYEITTCFYQENTTRCCKGYEYEDNQKVCFPKCENGCDVGRCIAKNVCSCDSGFKWNKSLKKCECNEGYTESSNKTCIPYCESGCEHGICVHPNKCRCSAGYDQKDLNGTSICEPICSPPCKNGKCIRPNICDCDKGLINNDKKKYECHCGLYCQEVDKKCKCLEEDERISGSLIQTDTSSLQTKTESGISSHCLNGFTSSTGICICAIGYTFHKNYTDICEPICDQKCDENSFCEKPNECQCKGGYKFGENDGERNRCYPECENGFENDITSNFACLPSALHSEPMKAESNWVLPVIGLVFIVLAAVPIALFILRRRKMGNSSLPRPISEELPTFDIEVYPMEEL